MGRPDDPLVVVDEATRVIGLERVCVVDASIMPQITNGNLNAPTIMLAEKAADHILGCALLQRDQLLPPSSRPDPWRNPLSSGLRLIR
jgi:choline dehydrogenase